MTSRQGDSATCREIQNAPALLGSLRQITGRVQTLAREKFRLWKRDAFHPSMQFKPLIGNVWSVRIGNSYRALARRHGDLAAWFWIGTHEEYNNFIKQLR